MERLTFRAIGHGWVAGRRIEAGKALISLWKRATYVFWLTAGALDAVSRGRGL